MRVTAKAGSAGKLFGAVTAKEIADALSEQHASRSKRTRSRLRNTSRRTARTTSSASWLGNFRHDPRTRDRGLSRSGK